MLGPRATLDASEAGKVYAERLVSLGDVGFCDIEVAPFKTERLGAKFGLIVREPDEGDDGDERSVEMQPGNYMGFYDPWDGDRDT